MNAFLDGLTRLEQCVFLRRFWYLDTVSEIAERYGMSEQAVYRQLARLKKRFTAFWKGGER